jgi:hypothetical protein
LAMRSGPKGPGLFGRTLSADFRHDFFWCGGAAG